MFKVFFSKLFSSTILDNEIVATILYVISNKTDELNEKISSELNEDI